MTHAHHGSLPGEEIDTQQQLDALPVGSIVADLYIPDSPVIACKAVRGWAILGDDPDRRWWSFEMLQGAEGRPLTVLHVAPPAER
jgi:hypothetical protein